MTTTIRDDVLDILKQVETDGDKLKMQHIEMPRSMYEAVNKVLEACGGKWNRKEKAHLFDSDAAEIMGDVVSTGEYMNEKKEYQFFETVPEIVEMMMNRVDLKAGETACEPSAGHGAIAKAMKERTEHVHCIELNPKAVKVLEEADLEVEEADFLCCDPVDSQVDAIAMNPPFTRSQDIKHITHAWQFLKPGGRMVALASIGYTFRGDKLATGFREFLKNVGAKEESIEAGTFKSSGTMVKTMLITATKK